MELSRKPYDWEARVDGMRGARLPHPVTRMLKRVLKLTLEVIELPSNPLDTLIHQCGGSDLVAEMTGRAKRLEYTANGRYAVVSRAVDGVAMSKVNLTVRALAARTGWIAGAGQRGRARGRRVEA